MRVKTKSTAAKPANGRVSKKAKVLRPPAAAPAPTPAKAKPEPKDKRVEGRFSMPKSDYALIAQLKAASKQNGHSVKKNEVIRAGLRALSAMPPDDLLRALAAINPAKVQDAR